MVMELVEGITLKEYIAKKEKLTPKEVISITLQVCAGMEAVHKGHIIHRDIKPQNIIISNEGKVKVTDFGIAKAASSNTTSSNAMGSVHYTSPEQARGGFSDEKSDIYSIGITMYEMVTGRVPFDGDSTVAIAMKHLQEEIVPPSEYVPMPYSLEQIILKCTQKNPDLRYPNVTLLAQDLRRSLSDPNGDFVKNGAAAYGAGADTVMISESDRRKLQNQYDDEYDDDDRYDDEYDDGYDDDHDDGYDDDDYDTRNLKTHRNKEEHTGKKPKMSNMMKIIIALVAVLVVCAAAYGIGAGLVKIYTPESNRQVLQQLLPEAIITTYEEESVSSVTEWADVIGIGPGLSKGKKAAEGKDPQRILIAEKWEGEYDIYHAKTAAGDIAAQLGAEPLGEAGWTDEQIVDANPEAIFAVHVSSVTDEEAIALYTENPALASVDAVKNGRIYPVVYSLAYTPGVRTIDTVNMFLKDLYGIE